MKQDPVLLQLTKQGQGMFPVASPNTQLLGISTSKAANKKSNKPQKQ